MAKLVSCKTLHVLAIVYVALLTYMGTWVSQSMKISCPRLECMTYGTQYEHLEENICFQHDGLTPTKVLKGDSCQFMQATTEILQGPVYCDFDLRSDKYAWVDESNQHLDSTTVMDKTSEKCTSGRVKCDKNEANSQIYGKRTQADCREGPSLFKRLLGGRNCTDSTQCINMECRVKDEGKGPMCVGRLDQASCYDSSDCHAGYFCEVSSDYPYLSICKTLRTSYERCTDTEQCQHNLYCWYANIESSPILKSTKDPSKQCLPMYSQRENYNYGWYSENLLAVDPATGIVPIVKVDGK